MLFPNSSCTTDPNRHDGEKFHSECSMRLKKWCKRTRVREHWCARCLSARVWWWNGKRQNCRVDTVKKKSTKRVGAAAAANFILRHSFTLFRNMLFRLRKHIFFPMLKICWEMKVNWSIKVGYKKINPSFFFGNSHLHSNVASVCVVSSHMMLKDYLKLYAYVYSSRQPRIKVGNTWNHVCKWEISFSYVLSHFAPSPIRLREHREFRVSYHDDTDVIVVVWKYA